MGQRIVFEVLTSAQQEHAKRLLERFGATNIQPHVGIPHTFTAIIPDNVDIQEPLSQLRATPGVGRAEVDAPRFPS